MPKIDNKIIALALVVLAIFFYANKSVNNTQAITTNNLCSIPTQFIILPPTGAELTANAGDSISFYPVVSIPQITGSNPSITLMAEKYVDGQYESNSVSTTILGSQTPMQIARAQGFGTTTFTMPNKDVVLTTKIYAYLTSGSQNTENAGCTNLKDGFQYIGEKSVTVKLNTNPEVFCTDTDGGNNFEEYGEVETEVDIYADECYGDVLTEYYCNGLAKSSYEKDCSTMIGSNFAPMICLDGACVEGEDLWCEESDNGKDYETFGTIEDSLGNVEEDICSSSSLLKEWYCENNQIFYEYKSCECEEGICITLECILLGDSNCDNKIDRSEMGTAISSWINGQITRDNLGIIIQSWIGG